MSQYQLLPPLANDEYVALRDDIAAHGVRVPVDTDEAGAILDGHHRARIAAELGVDLPSRVVAGLDDAGKRAHALSVNVHRRHLTREQRRELIGASLKADPELADVQHAKRTGVSDKTVTTVRRELEATSEIPTLDRTRGADGKERRAPLPKLIEAAVEELLRSVERIERLGRDDRWTQHAPNIAPLTRNDLHAALTRLTAVVETLSLQAGEEQT